MTTVIYESHQHGDEMMSTTKTLGTALITGASSGIGATYADRLARRGYDLILVARSKTKLEERARALAADADLTRVAQVLRDDPSISLLINNAGAASLGALANADIGRLESEIQLNI